MNCNTELTKNCTSCNKDFPATPDFWYKQKKGKYGLRSMCKLCQKIIRREYCSTEEYKKKHREKMRQYRENNPDKILEINRRCYKKNAERINENRRYRYKNDPEYKKRRIEEEIRYKESGGRYAQLSQPEQREKARLRSKKRRDDPLKRKHDYERAKEWREENKDHLHELHKKTRDELKPSYIAYTLGIPVNHLTPEVLKTKRLLIKIKRELKNKNVKIK